METEAVICSINDVKYSNVSRSLGACPALGVSRIERISDARSMCEGNNRGAKRTNAEWLIFCHDDIEVLAARGETLERAFQTLDVFGVCGTARLVGPNWYDCDPNYLRGSVLSPVPRGGGFEYQIFGVDQDRIERVQALDGIFIACRREVWEQLKFDESLPGFHAYDIDFSYRAYLAGFRVGLLTDLILYHASHVGDFTDAKVREWEASQELLRRKFNLRGTGDGYVKHKIVQVSDIDIFKMSLAGG